MNDFDSHGHPEPPLPNPPRRVAITPHTDGVGRTLEPGNELTIANESGGPAWVEARPFWRERAAVDAAERWREAAEVEHGERLRAEAERDRAIAERDAARETNRRLNDRCQRYESAIVEKIEMGRDRHRNLGRALANAAAAKAEAERDRAVAERDAILGWSIRHAGWLGTTADGRWWARSDGGMVRADTAVAAIREAAGLDDDTSKENNPC